MQVSKLMSRDVVTVAPDMPLAAAARLFAERQVTGAPVVDPQGAVVGIVTETDLERRLGAALGARRGWWSALFASAPAEAREFAKTHGRRVGDVMTTPVATISPHATVEEAARLLDDKGVRRLPVLEGERLVGVLSRADLLRAVLDPDAPAPTDGDDIAIRARLHAALRAEPWTHPYSLHYAVHGGVVTFYGFPAPGDVQRALRVLAEGVPGVRAVAFPDPG
ncbi:MAG: CBS domain-containing protein [Acetobacteraceae bacterium]|nr:CBS domain-containing protein [Acetobacteraceae bacterium]